MSRTKRSDTGRPVESYEHTDMKRLNNPPVGLVTPDTDPDAGPKTYRYDPHLDPQLVWAGKVQMDSTRNVLNMVAFGKNPPCC